MEEVWPCCELKLDGAEALEAVSGGQGGWGMTSAGIRDGEVGVPVVVEVCLAESD